MLWRYVTRKGAQRLSESIETVSTYEQVVNELGAQLEVIRNRIAAINKDIDKGGARQANVRDNIRVHKLRTEISTVEEIIAAAPVHEAAEARKNHEAKYNEGMRRAEELSRKVMFCLYLSINSYAHKSGLHLKRRIELAWGSVKDLRKRLGRVWTNLQAIYRPIDQSKGMPFFSKWAPGVCWVQAMQMSDMANNDLEKYAKALDK
jgi:DNA repair protein RAD50